MNKIIIIIFSLIIVNLCFSEELSEQDYYNKAKEYFKVAKYNEALEITNKGLIKYDSNLKLNLAKAMTLLAMEKYDLFFTQVNKLETIDICYIDIYIQYGMYYELNGDLKNTLLNYNIVKTLQNLNKKKIKINKVFLGDTSYDFNNSEGNIGYLSVAFDKKLKPILPIPEKEKPYNMIFSNFEIIDNNGTIMVMNNINDSSKYLIKSYKLLTIFLDSSKRYYQVYYKIKYK
ncbi:MAG: hypothetical protein JXB50_03050 [Spirochaetes bacterium]|nr:hypothetical protein [Spirochaetota bacterium]